VRGSSNAASAARIAIACSLLAAGTVANAQTAEGIDNSRRYFALPLELDFDSGAANGDATILRLQALYTFPVRPDWKLVHLTILTLADAPSGTPAFPGTPGSDNNSGISDLLHTSFYTPVVTGNTVWGWGAIATLPTATASGLGSGKWTAGPAVRVTHRVGNWNLGAVAGQRWSFAGSDNKNDVSQTMIRGAIRRQLGDGWYLVSAPIITANWKAAGEKWLVPVGGGIGRRFQMNGHPWAFSVQGYYNAIRPDAAPDWIVRLALVSAIPLGN